MRIARTLMKPKRAPKRVRKSYSLTLTKEAHDKGVHLAALRGIQFSPFVEGLIRKELRAAKLLPPEGMIEA